MIYNVPFFNNSLLGLKLILIEAELKNTDKTMLQVVAK